MKITIYELLGMIKDDKAPKEIKYDGLKWKFEEDKLYYSDSSILEEYCNLSQCLNDEVEIIEENKTKSLTKKDIETLGYACGEIQKCFTNGWTKSLENKPLEEHKIPEKLKASDYEEVRSQFDLDVISRINQILDYLEEIK